MKIPLTQERFLEKARKAHGNRYDYSCTIYVHSEQPVIIICKDCGKFTQRPKDHWLGHGCGNCTYKKAQAERKPKTKDLIKSFQKIHGKTYDYSRMNYVNSKTKIEVVCKNHGSFWLTANKHKAGQGCVKCLREEKRQKMSDKFFEQIKLIHGDKYNYSKSIYIDYLTPIIIGCPNHGDFIQPPNQHLYGKAGCPKCAFVNRGLYSRSTQEHFIKKSQKRHGFIYTYDCSQYRDIYTKVKIKCHKHGEFELTPKNHYAGVGCKKCNCTISPASQEWLTSLNIHEREYRIPNTSYRVDGFDPKTNTVYEYLGVYWHGHPHYFEADDINVVSKKTFGELYTNTLQRLRHIKSLGYKVKYKWEKPKGMKKISNKKLERI